MEQKTQGEIQKLIKNLDSETMMVLVNYLFFKSRATDMGGKQAFIRNSRVALPWLSLLKSWSLYWGSVSKLFPFPKASTRL